MNYGEVLLRLKRHEEAIKQYMIALQYDKSNADLHYNLGVVYLDLQQHQRAMNHFNDALHIAPDHKVKYIGCLRSCHECMYEC